MSATMETPDVQQLFIDGCLITGQAYSRHEAHGYFTDWLAETIRQAKAEAWEECSDEFCKQGIVQVPANPYAEEATDDHA